MLKILNGTPKFIHQYRATQKTPLVCTFAPLIIDVKATPRKKVLETLVATIQFLRSRANGSLISPSFTGFFRSENAHFVHSHIHLQSRANAALIHSIHANTITPFPRIVVTKLETGVWKWGYVKNVKSCGGLKR